MSMLVSWAAKNNMRLTSNISASSAAKWAKDRARVANDYLPDNEASYDTGGGSVVTAFANWKDKNYTSTAMYHSGAQSAGLHKKYAHGNMWRYKKILKKLGVSGPGATGQQGATYNASTTVQS